MTEDQQHEAIAQMMVHCDLKAAQKDYSGVMARAVLYTLGYNEDEADEVIKLIAEGGFTYCLDPMIPATHFDPNNPKAVKDMVTDYPSADACYWGDPMQLKSRLQSLSNIPYWVRNQVPNPKHLAI